MQVAGKRPDPGMKARIERDLGELIGLQMFKSWNVFATRMFYFANAGLLDRKQDGDYRLTIECPWRFEWKDRIFVGSEDYAIRAEANRDPNWDPTGDQWGHLQDEKLSEIFGEERDGSIYNTGSHLLVESVTADDLGGFRLTLSGGCALCVFPASGHQMEWLLSKRQGSNLALNNGVISEGEGKT